MTQARRVRLTYAIRNKRVFFRGKGQGLSKQSWGIDSMFGNPLKSAHELDEDNLHLGDGRLKQRAYYFINK